MQAVRENMPPAQMLGGIHEILVTTHLNDDARRRLIRVMHPSGTARSIQGGDKKLTTISHSIGGKNQLNPLTYMIAKALKQINAISPCRSFASMFHLMGDMFISLNETANDDSELLIIKKQQFGSEEESCAEE